MSYGLLWIETLVLALLWVEALIAVAARIRWRWAYALLVLVIVLLPLGALTLLTLATGLPRFASQVPVNNYCLSLTICFIAGALVLLRLAQRSGRTETGRAIASWRRSRLLLSLLVAAGVWTMTLWNMELEARSQLSALRAEAGALMLSVMPPPVSDEQNAALIYEKAFKRMDADPLIKWKGNYLENPLNQDNPENDPTVQQFLARQGGTVALITQAAKLPDCLFEHDYVHAAFSLPMPECEDLRAAAELLRLNVRQETAQGHLDAAIDDINAMAQLARHIGRSPFLVTTIISGAVDALAARSTEEILPRLKTVEQVAKLRLGDPERIGRSMRRAMLAEEALGMAAFCDLISEPWPGLPRQLGVLQPTVPATTFLRCRVLSDDFTRYRQSIERYRRLADKPYYQTHSEAEKIFEVTRMPQAAPRGFFTDQLLPSVSSAFFNNTRYAATLDLAHIALAATRYRIEKGEYPGKLDSLVPAYLPEIPLDPFDGKPMRMKLASDRLLIYSVGPDLQDNGGAEYDPKTRTADIVFSLKTK